jgi:hypothetical protein
MSTAYDIQRWNPDAAHYDHWPKWAQESVDAAVAAAKDVEARLPRDPDHRNVYSPRIDLSNDLVRR